jgi:hypothetical protein
MIEYGTRSCRARARTTNPDVRVCMFWVRTAVPGLALAAGQGHLTARRSPTGTTAEALLLYFLWEERGGRAYGATVPCSTEGGRVLSTCVHLRNAVMHAFDDEAPGPRWLAYLRRPSYSIPQPVVPEEARMYRMCKLQPAAIHKSQQVDRSHGKYRNSSAERGRSRNPPKKVHHAIRSWLEGISELARIHSRRAGNR